eukprot:UN30394
MMEFGYEEINHNLDDLLKSDDNEHKHLASYHKRIKQLKKNETKEWFVDTQFYWQKRADKTKYYSTYL